MTSRFTCGFCRYKTDKTSNFKRHQSRCAINAAAAVKSEIGGKKTRDVNGPPLLAPPSLETRRSDTMVPPERQRSSESPGETLVWKQSAPLPPVESLAGDITYIQSDGDLMKSCSDQNNLRTEVEMLRREIFETKVRLSTMESHLFRLQSQAWGTY